MVDLTFEQKYWNTGTLYVAGVDEAGRGPLAGPVVAAAVIFPRKTIIEGIDDSKKLTATKREKLFDEIISHAISVGIGIIYQQVIDEINILQATFRGMNEAIGKLSPPPEQLLVDGNRFRGNGIPFETIIDGDAKSFSIAAASIVAKVTRDRIMVEYDKAYPLYGFAKHKGYGTREHIAAIREHGLCEIHRRSFHIHTDQLTF